MSEITGAKTVGRARTAGNKITVRSVLIFTVLVLWALISLFPVYWMFTFSLKTTEEIFGRNVIGLPQYWVWGNYTRAMNTGHMEVYFLNSFIIAVITILITLVASAMATYAMTRLVWKGRDTMNKFFMLGLTIPIHAAIVPLYVVLGKVGLLNSHAALIIPYSAFSLAMGILICTGFMGDIPYDLDEAAFLDGCGVWGIFGRVIAPLMIPAAVLERADVRDDLQQQGSVQDTACRRAEPGRPVFNRVGSHRRRTGDRNDPDPAGLRVPEQKDPGQLYRRRGQRIIRSGSDSFRYFIGKSFFIRNRLRAVCRGRRLKKYKIIQICLTTYK